MLSNRFAIFLLPIPKLLVLLRLFLEVVVLGFLNKPNMIRSNASGLVQRRTEITKAAAATSKNKSDDESGDCDER